MSRLKPKFLQGGKMLGVARKIEQTMSSQGVTKKIHGIYFLLLDRAVMFHDGKEEIIENFSKISNQPEWLLGDDLDIHPLQFNKIQVLHRAKLELFVAESTFNNSLSRLKELVVKQ